PAIRKSAMHRSARFGFAAIVLVASCAKSSPTPAPAPSGGRAGAPPAAAPAPAPGRGSAVPAVDTSRYVRTTPATDATIRRIWDEGMNRSQVMNLAQVLFDSTGPRLINSDRYNAGQAWLMAKYKSWGITSEKQEWGTWTWWERGVTHLDLIAPRVRSLEATMLAWSPGTGGKNVDAEVILLPADTTARGIAAWLRDARGKFVLTPAPGITGPGAPSPTCRSQANEVEFGAPGQWSSDSAKRIQWSNAYRARLPKSPDTTANGRRDFSFKWPADAGVAGILSTYYSGYPGTDKVFGNPRQAVPTVDVTCEDWNLLYRLAENKQHPRVRLNAEAKSLGEKPVFNVIAKIPGSDKANEYIVLSAHYDSWDAGSGATDNGTGTVAMMEALRIIKATYPRPHRTIIVGHWGGEEQGLLGSRAFVADHPDIVNKVHMGWNQDNGTGRIQNLGPGPFTQATDRLVAYLKEMPVEATHALKIGGVGPPGTGGSDHSSFQCAKSPVVGLGGVSWDYGNLTWHTNRDTYDKVVPEDLKGNAVLVAMLVYEADRDPTLMPHDVIPTTVDAKGATVQINYTCPAFPRKTAEGR
ncbi:MAG: M20/M25/M40 family metallo-hydrolase, partial [Gemmatimonadota bacterium]